MVKDIFTCIALIFALIVFCILIMFGVNSCSRARWNNGVCPQDNIRYELRGVSKGLKYYVCPECGEEVMRY